ncbi:MAG TPA: lysyl oxidase family protein [Candidatus Saccharimonadales bacterium]|nr:lysyl oxidase family protein [Candidatus Saccharimonadales bacterium]
MNPVNIGIKAQTKRLLIRTIAFIGFSLSASLTISAALPDLAIYYPAIQPHVVYRTFDPNDCTVLEGCVQAGTRRLLSFTTQTRNIGGDLVLGNPATNALFEYNPCHNHYHYEGFAQYRLLDANLNEVVQGHKMGFCVEDVLRWDSTSSLNSKFDCSYQGIQKGWADVYSEDVPCQWVDITGVPGGSYTLEIVINPAHSIPEVGYVNNRARVPITLTSDCTPPVGNDSFGAATSVSGAPQSFESYDACATKEAGEPNHAGNGGGHSIWYKITVPTNGPIRLSTEGSDFDTLLAVYTGNSVSGLTLAASNDNINGTNKQSAVTFNAVAGTAYSIALDGFNAAFGKAILNINPPVNDAFANCQILAGTAGRTTGYNIGATREPGEPDHNFSFSWRSVWYCWTAPTNGPAVFDTIGSDFDTLLGIYTGNNVNALTRMASDNDSGGGVASRAMFNAVQGTTYRIAVDGTQGTSGNISLAWYPASRLAIRKMSGNSMQLTLSGGQGTYQLQGGTNLTNWTVLTNVTMGTSPQTYLDSAGIPRRFYRAVLTP